VHFDTKSMWKKTNFVSRLSDCGDPGRDSLLPASFPESRERQPSINQPKPTGRACCAVTSSSCCCSHRLLRVCPFCFWLLGGRLRVFTPVYILTLANSVLHTLHYLPLHRASLVDLPPALKHLRPSNVQKSPAEESCSASEIRVMGYELLLQRHHQAASY
jgi:hypothetical protein